MFKNIAKPLSYEELELPESFTESLIEENSIGEKIVNPEMFWKWFGDSITKDEQGRPLVFYHGTRSDFKEFKTIYGDKLVFFAFQKEFADKWGRKKSYDNNMSIEIEDILYTYKNKLFAEYKKKYGDDFYTDNDAAREKLLREVDNKRFELEKEKNVHNRTLGCYLKVHKIFYPEKDYEMVLSEICKYYEWKNPYTKEYEERLKEFENKYETAQKYWDKWWAENKDADEKTIKTETDKVDYAFRNFSVWRSIKNEFDNNIKRIKQGAWVYFEHENVINKIWELGYDAIQLSETNGEQTTLAVRTGNNQIKSIQNNGNYNSTENLYEDFQTVSKDKLNDNFKNWFGNSTVTTMSGDPIICYHGTNNRFRTFKHTGKSRQIGTNIGFYFTDNKTMAKWYGDRVLSVFLKIEKPFEIYSNSEINFLGEHLEIKDSFDFFTLLDKKFTDEEIKAEIIKQGYDGIRLVETSVDARSNSDVQDVYIVFNSNQIKSINNKGSWSDSENIYESLNRLLERYL